MKKDNHTHCPKCKTHTYDKKPKYKKNKNSITKVSECACGCKKTKTIYDTDLHKKIVKGVKNGTVSLQQGRGLISNLIGKPIPVLSDIPILNLLF